MESTLIPKGKAVFVKSISTKNLLRNYQNINVNVERIYGHRKNLALYRCVRTGYEFFTPPSVEGDSLFYEELQLHPWYYEQWKWEHEEALSYFCNGQEVLEVGCAHGSFLKKISESFKLIGCVGLELNKTTVTQNSRFSIKNESVEQHVAANIAKYDVVCSFQVLEHIDNVYSFIKAQIDVLKIGGTLIISVPNNDSYLGDSDDFLNCPPHHMGRWNEQSLRNLENIFPLEIVKVHIEGLRGKHVDTHIAGSMYIKRFGYSLGKILLKFDKLTGRYSKVRKRIQKNSQNIKGHTILISFKKVK